MSIEQGTRLVRYWAPKFGLGEYNLSVAQLPVDSTNSAESYYDLNEQWGVVWVPADGEHDYTTLELLVLHELAHYLFWGNEEHNESARTELNCDRVARLCRPDAMWIEQSKHRRMGSTAYFADDDKIVVASKAEMPNVDRRKWLSVVTDGLPARERDVITMLYFEGLSYSQAAEALGVPIRTLRRWRDNALIRIGEYYGGLDARFGAEDSHGI